MPETIVLSTINARYEHPSLGLRYLAAHLAPRQPLLIEFASKTPTDEIVREIARRAPAILGLSIAIWNVTAFKEHLPVLRKALPRTRFIAGGPEISHGSESHPLFPYFDHVIEGEADHAFAELCEKLLRGEKPEKILRPAPCDVRTLKSPYALYSDEDLRHRFTYVEASRGCPFTCEFCLSSLDVPVRRFELEPFLAEMHELYRRGARRFKFIDRTFNLSTSFSSAILEELLPLARAGAFFHFEIVPDRLAPELLGLAAQYPPGTLQFEVGIQTFQPEVAQRIGRRQDFETTERNLKWLREHSHVNLHADLIAGLPGENLASFGQGFNRLWKIGPQEIQVGILKKLRGAPIARHDHEWRMRYAPEAPYEILSTRDLDVETLRQLRHFARTVELFRNRGRFPALLELLVPDARAFERLLDFSEWLVSRLGVLHSLSLDRQFELLSRYLLSKGLSPKETVFARLEADYHAAPGRKPANLRKIQAAAVRSE